MPTTDTVVQTPRLPGTTLVHDTAGTDSALDHRSFLDGFVDVSAFPRLVAVCLDRSGEEMLAHLESMVVDAIEDVAIIDVGRQVRSTDVATVASPSNVIQGVGASDDPDATLSTLRSYLSPFDDSAGPALCLVDSLAPYVSRISPDAVLGFVEQFTYHVYGAGAQGVVWLDESCDEWVRQFLAEPFDTVLQRSADGVTDVTPVSSTDTYPPDLAFDLLTPQRRRYVLHALALSRHPSVSLDDLVAQVYRWDDAADTERHVRLRLIHTDLPKLKRNGVITYDLSEQRVGPDFGLAALRPGLRRVAARDFGTDAS